MAALTEPQVASYLRESRELVLDEIRALIPNRGRLAPVLYDLMLDYPLRAAKALRPALCIATCRAFDGRLEAVLRSAAVVELYHNAFLVHDDVEDQSEKRRDQPTLPSAHGVPIAVNVGDAMLAISLRPLLDNMHTLGLGKALRILQIVARMAQESAEGQAMELDWVRRAHWQISDADYLRMILKKTSWYSFVTPVLIGATIAGVARERMAALRAFAVFVGVAFQIQDDVLNLTADERVYGKEIGGDLWEGKHTLMLLHAMRSASESERRHAEAILLKARPTIVGPGDAGASDERLPLDALLDQMERQGEIGPGARERLRAAFGVPAATATKTPEDIRFLQMLIERYRSVDYARGIARRWSTWAMERFDRLTQVVPPSVHRDFLEAMTGYVVGRDW